MKERRTTICCSWWLGATAVFFGAWVVAAQDAAPSRALIFPLAQRWTLPLAARPTAWATFDPDRAYVPLRNGSLVAVSLSDGRIEWTADHATSLQAATGDGLVFLANGATITAFDAATAVLRWQASLESDIAAPPFWDTGWLVVGTANGDVIAFRGRDGARVWHARLDGVLSTAPSIAADRVYLPLDDGRIVSLDLRTGTQQWMQTLGGHVGRILALDDRLFAGATNNFFYCLALADGMVKWRWRTGGDLVGMPQVDHDRVYFVALDNLLRAVDRGSGVQQWRRDLPMRPSTGLQRIGDVLLVSGLTPEIAAFYAENGQPAGSLKLAAELVGPPHYLDHSPEGGPLLVLLTTQVSGESQMVAFGPSIGPPLTPFSYVPGAPVVPPMPADVPLRYVPGTAVGPAPAPGGSDSIK